MIYDDIRNSLDNVFVIRFFNTLLKGKFEVVEHLYKGLKPLVYKFNIQEVIYSGDSFNEDQVNMLVSQNMISSNIVELLGLESELSERDMKKLMFEIKLRGRKAWVQK